MKTQQETVEARNRRLRSVWKKYMEESRRENAYKRGYAQGYEAALALLTHCYKHLHE